MSRKSNLFTETRKIMMTRRNEADDMMSRYIDRILETLNALIATIFISFWNNNFINIRMLTH
jgi:hypothetical protein